MEVIKNLLKKYLQINESVLAFSQIGNKLLLILLLVVFNLKFYGQYVPPIGIPAPEFGIDEVAPTWPVSWPAEEVVNFYYIDNTHPNTTNSSNTYGTPDRPRTSIPEITYSAGSYVEVHGGPYRGGGQIIFTANGTADNPVWIRGESSAERGEIIGEMIVKGSHIIIENLVFSSDNARISIRPHNSSHAHHVSVRNNEMYGSGTDVGFRSAIGINGSDLNRFNDIVVYNNHIYNRGDHRPEAGENDYHGVAPGRNVDRVWILNNHIHHLGGDSVQVGVASLPDNERADSIYIGGNSFHDDHENALDIKEANNIFAIDNDFHDYEYAASGGGAAVVIHNGPIGVWIINNRIYDSEVGIVTTGASNSWFIGNTIWNIHTDDLSTWNTNSGYSDGVAIHFRASSGGAINNTLYNYDTGIQLTTAGPYVLNNNILFGRAQSTGYDLRIANSSVRNLTTSDYNLYESANINFGAGSGTNLAVVQSLFSQEVNSPTEANPFVMSAGTNDFRLQSVSTAIDNGVLNSIYATYFSLYGKSIEFDMSDVARPQDSFWDIGAFEFETTLSISDEIFDASISIFPNPTNDTLTIELGNDILKKVIIYNKLGQYMKETTSEKINISNLSKGVYFVKIVSQSGKETTKKIIKN